MSLMSVPPMSTPMATELSSTKSTILIINARRNPFANGAGLSSADVFEKQLLDMDDIRKPGMPGFDVRHLDDLELSVDQGHKAWVAIAEVIEAEYLRYDGFVVQYGTETMVYGATALSFMLENLGKPVMFTGSLIPANLVQSDMKRNLVLALLFAQNADICEVCIVFAERLFRANRTFKISRQFMQPFVSPNMQPLAVLASNKVRLERHLLQLAPRGRLRVHKQMSAVVLTLKLLPGMTESLAVHIAETTHAKAIIICAFGSGNVPQIRSKAMVRLTTIAGKRGILVVVCTQNRYGTIEPTDYASGKLLIAAGAVGAGDMTIEATIQKLKFLFGQGYNVSAVRDGLLKNLRGEVSEEQAARLLSNL